MKYRNVETGVILEPGSAAVAEQLAKSGRYLPVAEPAAKPKAKPKKAGEV